jgi:hypothetical protein
MQTTGDNPQSAQQSRPGRTEEREIDIIDMIAFVWRYRLSLILSTCLGLGASTAYFIWANSTSVPGAASSFHVAKIFVTDVVDGKLAASYLNYVSKTPDGAQAALAGVKSQFQLSEKETSELLAAQQQGNGLLSNFEGQESEVSFRFYSKEDWRDSQIQLALQSSLQGLTDVFNSNFADSTNDKISKVTKYRMEQARLFLEATILSEKYSQLSKPLRNDLVQSVMREYMVSRTADSVVFLLAEVPDSIERKNEILLLYTDLINKIEGVLARNRNAAKVLNVERILPIKLSNDGSLQVTLQKASLAQAPAISNKKLMLLLALGAVLGGFCGLLGCIFYSFWKANYQRIVWLFESQRRLPR